MSDDFDVMPSVLRDDSKTWMGWEEKLSTLVEAVPRCGEGQLHVSDFSGLPGADVVVRAYLDVSGRLVDQGHIGCQQFSGISDKLTSIADIYDGAEGKNEDAIKATMTAWGDER